MAGAQPVPRRPNNSERINQHEWQRWREDVRKTITDLEASTVGDLSTLTAQVATNTSDISTNSSDITALDVRVTQNETDISSLESQLGTSFTPFELGSYRGYSYTADVTAGFTSFRFAFSGDVVRTSASSFGRTQMNIEYDHATGLVDFYFLLIPDLTTSTIYGTCEVTGLDVTDGTQKLIGTVYDFKLGAITDTELDYFYVQRTGGEIRFGFDVAGYSTGLFDLSVQRLK